MYILRNTRNNSLLVQDQYLSQPFEAQEEIDLESIFSFEQLHKSTYYSDGAIGSLLLNGDLELLHPTEGYRQPLWKFSDPRVEYVTLTFTEISQKKLLLKETPNKQLIAVDILGGPAQFPELDFTVADRELKWDSRGMEMLLEVGDTLRIIYGS